MDIEYRDQFVRRLQTVHGLYYEACDTMTQEQVNYVEKPGVLPIAFSLVHIVLMVDSTLWVAGGPAPLFNDEWAEKMGLAIADHGKELTVDEMMHQKIGDFEEFKKFMRLVFTNTENFIAGIEPADFSRVLLTYPYPEKVAKTFSARMGREDGITVSIGMECWVYQHLLRHMGEIEHARGLVGLEGMTS